MRNSFLKLSFILALAVASTSYSFAAAKFNGNISFYSSGNLVGYNIPQIYNTSSTYSTGTLAMYVVGTYAPYYGVGLIDGTELYVSPPFDGLYPSYVYNNDSGVVAFSDAPANYTYLWVGLYEYNGFEYVLSDYQNILVTTYFPAPTDPLAVSSHPTSLNLNVGQRAAFSVTASGTDLSYQWKKDGVNIDGATSSSFTIASVSETDSGSYKATVMSSTGVVESNAAILTVNIPNIPEDPVWEPQGWVYYAWPYAYSISEGRWHFFDTTGTQWRVNLSNGQWRTLAEATGWNYYAWPYSYSIDQSTWHWYNADTQWVVDLVTGIWETLGSSED
jgi:hypothetical protein